MIPPQRTGRGCNMQCQVCGSGNGLQGRGQVTEAAGASGRKAVNYEELCSSLPSQGCYSAVLPAQQPHSLLFSTLQVLTKSSICALQLLWELSKHQNLTSISHQSSSEGSFLAGFSTLNLSCSISSTPWDFWSHLAETVPPCLKQWFLVSTLEFFHSLGQVPSTYSNSPTHRPFPLLQCPKTCSCFTAGSIPNDIKFEYIYGHFYSSLHMLRKEKKKKNLSHIFQIQG